jgi:hypothetical protein
MSIQWYVRRGDEVFGPFDAAKMKALAAKGEINPSMEVAQQAGGPWHAARTVRGLFPASPPAAPAKTPDSAFKKPPLAESPPTTKPPGSGKAEPTKFEPLTPLEMLGALGILFVVGTLIYSVATIKKEEKKPSPVNQRIAQHGFEIGFGAASVGIKKPSSDEVDALCRRAASDLDEKATWGFKMIWKDGFWAGWKSGGG